MVEVGHQVIAHRFVAGEPAAKGAVAKDARAEGGKTPAGVLQAAVRVEQLRPADAHPRIGLHAGDQRRQRAGTHNGVGIEQQHVIAGALPDGLVVGVREAGIGGIADQADVRILHLHHLRAAVAGGVVDHEHFNLQRAGARSEGIQAAPQVFTRIPVHNADG